MSSQFDKLRYEFIIDMLAIFEKYGGLSLPGKNYPEPRPLEALPNKDKSAPSQIEKLANELGDIFTDLLTKVEQPLLKYFHQKKLEASSNHARFSVPRCFGMEHSDRTICQICQFEFNCERTIFN